MRPYRIVTRARVPPSGLNLSLSLGTYLAAEGLLNEWPGTAPPGIRTNHDAIRNTVDAFAWRAHRDPAGIPSILALAGGNGRPTNIVLDGAIRALAARQAGVDDVATAYVATNSDPELVFLGLRHGLGLTTEERNSVIRALAVRWRSQHRGSRWRPRYYDHVARYTGLSAATVETLTRGYLKHRTVADRLAAAVAVWDEEPAQAVATRYGISRQALYKDLRLITRLRPEIERLGVATRAAAQLIDRAAEMARMRAPVEDLLRLLTALAEPARSIVPAIRAANSSPTVLGSQIVAVIVAPLFSSMLRFRVVLGVDRDPELARRDLPRLLSIKGQIETTIRIYQLAERRFLES
jgi:hypothetical protein